MINRKEELENVFKEIDENEKKLVEPLIDEVIYIEEQMEFLKTLPFININPKNKMQQKTTPASKLYKEFSQSYMSAIRTLCSLLHKSDGGEEDPVVKFLESRKNV